MVHRILIIDAEPMQRELLTSSLQNRLGYMITAIASAGEDVSCFYSDSAAPPDLILFDWSEGSMDNLAPSVKSLSQLAPLVVLVKYGDYEAAVAALNAGAQDFLMKPAAMERISITFRNLLLLRDMQREVDRLRGAHSSDAPPAPSAPYGGGPFLASFPLTGDDGNIRRMEDIEAEAIRFAMQYYHGHMTEVARRLGIGRSTLYRKLSGFSIRQEKAA
jgi:DNA-binding NtrC family response regulator